MKLVWLTDLHLNFVWRTEVNELCSSILTVGVNAVLVTGKGFTISIPILMLGPYLRTFMYWLIGVSAVVCVLLFVIAVFTRTHRDDLVLSAFHWLVFALTAGAITLILHFLGMP
jgi:uncharacterized membrane protein YuzA (DUF378 family)